MTGERSTNNFGRRGEEEKEKEEETVPSLREGRGLAAFPGPASQRRAEISGNRLTIFLWKSPNGTALTTTPQQMTAARQNGPAK
ncbi:unnamed protein product [Prorocentrum cordatum]|uniref:Uncharacterized protein n=1 Tax=Prorocentrum cordatum TaxID=2364126 RepID=A0ABN9S7Y0_9DINO|nr:unnamed protein product [Polarella glacialis]